VSRLAVDHPEIVELDLNPVVAFPGEKPALVLDARVRIAASAAGSISGAEGEKDVPAGVPAAAAPSR
jgi:acyl-CoA synthetase (NDP forming)